MHAYTHTYARAHTHLDLQSRIGTTHAPLRTQSSVCMSESFNDYMMLFLLLTSCGDDDNDGNDNDDNVLTPATAVVATAATAY